MKPHEGQRGRRTRASPVNAEPQAAVQPLRWTSAGSLVDPCLLSPRGAPVYPNLHLLGFTRVPLTTILVAEKKGTTRRRATEQSDSGGNTTLGCGEDSLIRQLCSSSAQVGGEAIRTAYVSAHKRNTGVSVASEYLAPRRQSSAPPARHPLCLSLNLNYAFKLYRARAQDYRSPASLAARGCTKHGRSTRSPSGYWICCASWAGIQTCGLASGSWRHISPANPS